jgi:hypothetical protein
LLGLERLERAQRAHELGHGGAAVAHQCLEAAGAVAIPDQGHADAPLVPAPLGEQLHLHAVGTREPPGGDRDLPGEHGLQRADRRELLEERRLERGELGGILVREHDELLRAQAVFERILCGARLAFRALWPARLGAVPAARLGTRMAHGGCGARWRGADLGHGGIPCGVVKQGGWLVRGARRQGASRNPLS